MQITRSLHLAAEIKLKRPSSQPYPTSSKRKRYNARIHFLKVDTEEESKTLILANQRGLITIFKGVREGDIFLLRKQTAQQLGIVKLCKTD